MLFKEIYFCSVKLLLSSENESWTNEKICLEIWAYFVSASSYCNVTDHWHFKIKCIATFLISYLITSIFVWAYCKAIYILYILFIAYENCFKYLSKVMEEGFSSVLLYIIYFVHLCQNSSSLWKAAPVYMVHFLNWLSVDVAFISWEACSECCKN